MGEQGLCCFALTGLVEVNGMYRLLRNTFLVLIWVAASISPCNAQVLNADPSKKTSPESCETHSLILDMMRNEVMRDSGQDGVVIAVARLGKGEVSRDLNRRRLFNLRVHWEDYGLPAAKLISAEGERANGYGRVELYVAGKLFDVLLVSRKKDLCVDCCDMDERLYPYRVKKR